jgi:flagellar biogenesis protein FliO
MNRLVAAFLLLLVPAAPALGQRLGQAQGSDVPIWRVMIALIFCLALAAAAALLLRRRLGGGRLRGIGRERRLRLIESIRIGRDAHLSIVSCDGSEMLIASGPQGTNLVRPELTPLPAPRGEPE